MKIAVISMTQNDYARIEEWSKYSKTYINQVYKHIIVDNASDEAYYKLLQEYFPTSFIIRRKTNGGCTGAYNDGIRLALSDPEVEAIALIGNDVELEPNCLSEMIQLLSSNPRYGMVGALTYFRESHIVENYGVDLNLFGRPIYKYINSTIDSLPESREVSYVPGGINLARRLFYEKVGLQDENLFLYFDEIDMYFRAKKCGYIEAITKNAICWHQHKSSGNQKPQYAYNMAYLNGRNQVYVAKKHYAGLKMSVVISQAFIVETLVAIKHITSAHTRKRFIHYCKGMVAGLKGNMSNEFLK